MSSAVRRRVILEGQGTKAAAHFRILVPSGDSETLQLRLSAEEEATASALWPRFRSGFSPIGFEKLTNLYAGPASPGQLKDPGVSVSRQAYAGLLWSKQFYHYVVKDWLKGDPEQPAPPESPQEGRNHDWPHLYNRDVISMPDKWEYPWYAAWDLAFHMLPFARIDSDFAKEQLVLFLREWYMHPNGQLPAYEWALSDVNPPVHAWACWRIYKITGPPGKRTGSFCHEPSRSS